jgi:signal transduction histidine kinase
VKHLRTVSRYLPDALLVALATLQQVEIWGMAELANRAAIAVIALGTALPLLARRRLPVVSCLFSMAALSGVFALDSSGAPFSVFITLMVDFWFAGLAGTRRQVALCWGAGSVAVAVGAWAGQGGQGLEEFGQTLAVLLAATVGGYLIGHRSRQAAQLLGRAERAEQAESDRVRLALAEERTRIARELHDIIAHSLSVVIIQSVAASGDPDAGAVQQRVGAIEHTARQSLADMRRLLGILHGEGPVEASPAPGIAAIGDLAERLTASGLPVAVDLHGTSRPLAPGLDLVAYRVVQESLTNTLRHAGPANASVSVRYSADHIEICVSDTGAGRAKDSRDGHGLIGMRERVAIYGGEFSCGPGPGGGFRTRALLPTADGAA